MLELIYILSVSAAIPNLGQKSQTMHEICTSDIEIQAAIETIFLCMEEDEQPKETISKRVPLENYQNCVYILTEFLLECMKKDTHPNTFDISSIKHKWFSSLVLWLNTKKGQIITYFETQNISHKDTKKIFAMFMMGLKDEEVRDMILNYFHKYVPQSKYLHYRLKEGGSVKSKYGLFEMDTATLKALNPSFNDDNTFIINIDPDNEDTEKLKRLSYDIKNGKNPNIFLRSNIAYPIMYDLISLIVHEINTNNTSLPKIIHTLNEFINSTFRDTIINLRTEYNRVCGSDIISYITREPENVFFDLRKLYIHKYMASIAVCYLNLSVLEQTHLKDSINSTYAEYDKLLPVIIHKPNNVSLDFLTCFLQEKIQIIAYDTGDKVPETEFNIHKEHVKDDLMKSDFCKTQKTKVKSKKLMVVIFSQQQRIF